MSRIVLLEYLSKEWLHYYADEVEVLFYNHQIDAVVERVQVSPRWVRFVIQLGYGTRISSIETLSEELSLVLETAGVRIVRSGGQLALEAPRSNPEPVLLTAFLDEKPMLPPVTPILGLTAEGEACTLPLMAPEVSHVLIAGATGCGKTELLRTILMSLAYYNRQAHLQMVLIDPKRRGFTPLEGLPHLIAPVAYTEEDAITLLQYTVGEMERRDREGASSTPRIVIAIDEVSDMLSTSSKLVTQLLTRLAQRGREAGFHLLLSTQRPSADALPGSVKANLPARIVGKVTDGREAVTATGVSGTNAEQLIGSGDFIAVVASQVTRFQAAYTGPIDLHTLTQQINGLDSNLTDLLIDSQS